MATKTYRLKIVREGSEFEAEGDKAFVLDMLKRFAFESTAQPTPSSQIPSKKSGKSEVAATVTRGKGLAIREFIQQLAFKKHTDITLAFGYYLEKHLGIPEFTAADINNCYYDAKLEKSNTSQMIAQNIKRGYMMPSKRRGEKGKARYTVTASGEKFIESKVPRS